MSIPELLSTGYTPLPHEHQLVPDDRRFQLNLLCTKYRYLNQHIQPIVDESSFHRSRSTDRIQATATLCGGDNKQESPLSALRRLSQQVTRIVKKIGPIDQITEQYFELST